MFQTIKMEKTHVTVLGWNKFLVEVVRFSRNLYTMSKIDNLYFFNESIIYIDIY